MLERLTRESLRPASSSRLRLRNSVVLTIVSKWGGACGRSGDRGDVEFISVDGDRIFRMTDQQVIIRTTCDSFSKEYFIAQPPPLQQPLSPLVPQLQIVPCSLQLQGAGEIPQVLSHLTERRKRCNVRGQDFRIRHVRLSPLPRIEARDGLLQGCKQLRCWSNLLLLTSQP
jgi:hypothetical protein